MRRTFNVGYWVDGVRSEPIYFFMSEKAHVFECRPSTTFIERLRMCEYMIIYSIHAMLSAAMSESVSRLCLHTTTGTGHVDI